MNTLQKELATYSSKLHELSAQSGKFVLVKGDDLVGFFDSYADALREGYQRYGLDSFLVKQVDVLEKVLHITRDVDPICH